MQDHDVELSDPTGARIFVGRWTYGYDDDTFRCYSPHDVIRVGRFTSLAAETRILGGGEHALDLPSTYPLRSLMLRPQSEAWDSFAKGPTVVGNDVWLGYRALVLSGVTIGDGAVVAAGSVVTHDVPPYTVVAGNPARPLRRRFDAATAARLQATRWWDWDAETLRAMEPWMYSDVHTFLEVAERAAAA